MLLVRAAANSVVWDVLQKKLGVSNAASARWENFRYATAFFLKKIEQFYRWNKHSFFSIPYMHTHSTQHTQHSTAQHSTAQHSTAQGARHNHKHK
jgi:hypothetical protein